MKVLITYPQSFLGIFLKKSLQGSFEVIDDETDYEDASQAAVIIEKIKPDIIILNVPFCGGIKCNTDIPADLMTKNLAIQSNVLRSAFKSGLKKIIFIGSSCMYPKIYDRKLKTEDLLSGPLEESNLAYATAKITGWQMCRAYNQEYGTKYMTVIPSNLYGEHDDFNEDRAHVISALLMRFHRAKQKNESQVVVWGTGAPVRDFLYAADFGQAMSLLISKDSFFDVVNVGSGVGNSIKEIAESIAGVVGYQGNIVFDATKPDGMKMKVLDTQAINRLGWSAQTTLKEGLRKVYDGYKKI